MRDGLECGKKLINNFPEVYYMKKVLLIQLSGERYTGGVYPHSEPYANKINHEPLGLEYIGAQIAGEYKVRIIVQRDMPNGEILEEIKKFNPNIIGFTVFTFAALTTQKICKKIKEYNSKIITVVGGYHPSGYPQMVRDKNIDFAVIGEGEMTFRELIKTLERAGDVSKVDGIAYWDDGLKITRSRERIKNLDHLMFPFRIKKSIKKYFFSSVAYSRGCPFGCSFCDSKKIWGSQVIWRSPKNVIQEIKELQKMGAKEFYFTDLTFNSNKEKVLELCDEIKKEGVDIDYTVMCTPRLMDRELLEKMKESGCKRIQYGIEALDAATLKMLGGKKELQAFSKIKNILKLTSSMGIHMRNLIMIGYPTDNKERLLQTKVALKILYRDIKKSKSPVGDIRISFFTPFPTQSLYEQYKKKGLLLTGNFNRYTTNIPVVKCGVSSKELIKIREELYREVGQCH